MPVTLLENEGKMSATEYALLQRVLNKWFDTIETDPVLLIGTHRPTGGTTILQYNRSDGDPTIVLEILGDVIAYMARSQSNTTPTV